MSAGTVVLPAGLLDPIRAAFGLAIDHLGDTGECRDCERFGVCADHIADGELADGLSDALGAIETAATDDGTPALSADGGNAR